MNEEQSRDDEDAGKRRTGEHNQVTTGKKMESENEKKREKRK